MSERKWLKDWDNFDFDAFASAFDEAYINGNPESVISREEVIDMMEYLKENSPALIEKAYYYDVFVKNGCSEEEALYLTEHIEEVKRILENCNK